MTLPSLPSPRRPASPPASDASFAVELDAAVLGSAFAKDPEGLARLRQLEPSGRVSSVIAGTRPVVCLDGRKLHSGRHPKQEAERFVRDVELDRATVVVLMGYGSGYVARALRARTDARLVIFEPEIEVLAVGLSHGRFPDDSLLCTTPGNLGEVLTEVLQPGDEGQLVSWQPSVRLDPDAYGRAIDQLNEAITRAQQHDASVEATPASAANIAVQTKTAAEVWNDHGDETYRQDQSHWRGVGRWKDDQLWKDWGQTSVHKFNAIGDYVGLGARMWSQRWNILEWGPGGGAHLHALHGHAHTYYGVDISARNLGEAGRMIAEEGFHGFRPILVEEDPLVVPSAVEAPIDLFLSSAVFQHFPSKRYGVEVLKVLAKVCRPGALGYIQIRFDNNNANYAPIRSLDDYRERHITATSYALDEFWDLCQNSGFDVLFISQLASVNNYATFNLRRRG